MRLGVVFSGVIAVSALACTELRSADERAADPAPAESDAGSPSAPTPLVTPEPPAAEVADRACSEPWVREKRTDAKCTARQVRVIDPEVAIDVKVLSVARTAKGRIGVVYNAHNSEASGEMRFVTFEPDRPDFAQPTILVRRGSDYDHLGLTSRITATSTDTFLVLAHDVADVDESGDLRVFTIPRGQAGFGKGALVLAGLARKTETAFVADPSGGSYVTARVPTEPGKARLVAFRDLGTGTYQPLPHLAFNVRLDGVPQAGATSLHVDSYGRLHALFQSADSTGASAPRYHALNEAGWTYRKTLDAQTQSAVAGSSPRIATSGNRKVAVYFSRPTQSEPDAKADLRLASWSESDATPDIEILESGILSPDAAMPGYRTAMAVDAFGLVHLAVVLPNDEEHGRLEYRRQVTVNGAKVWLRDVIDDAVGDPRVMNVDMAVDERGRPHIVYQSMKDLKVRYATRFDR